MIQPRTFRPKKLIILPLVSGGIPLQSLSSPNNMQQPCLANADLACAVTRSGKVIHHPTEQPVDTQPRSAKRRRTDASTFEATAIQTDEVSNIPFDDKPAALSALQAHNTAPNDLQARAATNAGTSSIHGNGTNLLHLSIGAETDVLLPSMF